MHHRMTSFDKCRERLTEQLRLKPFIVLKYFLFIDFPVWVFKAAVHNLYFFFLPNEKMVCVSQAFSPLFGTAVAVALENPLPRPGG